jgi:hypothetical protein
VSFKQKTITTSNLKSLLSEIFRQAINHQEVSSSSPINSELLNKLGLDPSSNNPTTILKNILDHLGSEGRRPEELTRSFAYNLLSQYYMTSTMTMIAIACLEDVTSPCHFMLKVADNQGTKILITSHIRRNQTGGLEFVFSESQETPSEFLRTVGDF